MILITCELAPDLMTRVYPRAYHEATRAQFNAVPGAQWDPKERCYHAPLEVAEIVLGTLERAGVARVQWKETPPERPTESALKMFRFSDMRPYQIEGAKFLAGCGLETGSALLADDVGVGKTAQALAAAQWLANSDTARVLIVCPAIVVEHWIEQGQHWIGQKIEKIQSKKPTNWTHWGVISWDTLRNCFDRMPPAYLVILDEVHNASSSRSQRSQAVRKYLDSAERPIVFGLTGTPMTARPRDLHHPLDLLWPKRFGRWYGFTKRYCNGFEEEIPGLEYPAWNSKGSSNLQELGARLQRLMLRRTKAQVQPDLPERTRTVIPIELPAYAAKKLQFQTRWADDVDGKSLRRVLAGIEEHKLRAAAELTQDLVAQGQKVLVYTLTRSAAQKIAQNLKTTFATGAHTPAKREKNLLEGLERHHCAVATMFSVTEGINYLVGFNTGVYAGVDWIPKTLVQTEGRIHRFGQQSSVHFYYLIGLRTIDEIIRSVVIERLESFAEVIGNADDERELAADLDASSGNLLDQIVEQAKEFAKRSKDDG